MMWPTGLFAGRRYAVLGLGRNGLPAARALAAMGAHVTAWDDNEAARASLASQAAGVLEARDPAVDIASYDALVLSPGIPHRLPIAHPVAAAALVAGVPVWSDAELLFQAVRIAGSRARFVGVTGTNGKSTTTALLAHILSGAGLHVAAGGNLGPAALALPLLGDDGVYVLEMSSYMLERLATLRFQAAAMLNLSPDHLDRHGDMAAYAAAKRAIFDRQDAGDLTVVGTDDAGSRAMATEFAAVTVSGGHEADVWSDGRQLRDQVGPILLMAEAPTLPGAHNAQNAAARALGCYRSAIWIAGGVSKAGGVAPLAPLFPRVAHALLIGRDGAALASELGSVPHDVLGTLEQAVPAARDAAARLGADVVLLSPACASFDQFSGFEARGRRFAELAQGLMERAA